MWILFFGAWGGLSSPFRKRDIFPRVEDSSAASHGSLITACVTPSQCVCRGAAEEQQKVLRAEGIEVNPVGGEMTSAAWDAPSLVNRKPKSDRRITRTGTSLAAGLQTAQ